MHAPEDDLPHLVPPQALMAWKENWVFPALDTEQRVASLFHVSLRPRDGEGIFTAKLAVDGWEHRYVGRSPVPAELAGFHPIANERLRLEILEPAQHFRIAYESDEVDADIRYTARFPRYDFDGPKAPGESLLGEIGRSVFPFNHHEQSLRHEGTLTLKAGPRAGETLQVAGYACRDHSWGWRDDLSFRYHHWLCASFDDRFVQGSAMEETYYPHGPKSGGWISTAAGNDPVVDVDTSGAYWSTPNEPLPPLDRDVRYRIRTVGGVEATVVAHLAGAYARLYLSARSPDRTQVYQDVQIFCGFTLEETGQRGAGVLEVGKFVEGPDAVERTRAPAPRVNEAALAEWLAAKLGAPAVRIVDLRRHTEGFSWETYTLDAEHDGERRGFALRVEPQDGLLAPYDVGQQFRLHCAIHTSSDVPMPEPYWLELDRRVLGMPFYAMERLRGHVPVQWQGDDPEVFPTPAVRTAVGREFVRVQASIHAIDWRRDGLAFLGEGDDAEAATLAQIERWSSFYERSALVEVPLLRHAMAWLRANAACSGRLALCHGDYRIGNFMLRDGRIIGVFDWELAHVSDPIEDVAYSGLPLWRGRGELLSQLLPADEYFRCYEEHAGLPVDPPVYRFWTVLGLAKAASVHLAAARAFEESRTNDLRLAALGHQVHYVLRLLASELES